MGSACGAGGSSGPAPVRCSARVLRHVPTAPPPNPPTSPTCPRRPRGSPRTRWRTSRRCSSSLTQVGEVLRALGQNPTEGDVKKLVQSTNSKGGPDARVTFETFLPLLQAVSGKKITDTVDDFVEGLRHFDKEGNGRISAIELRHLLTGLGEKMSEEEVEQLIHGKEDSQGNINYEEFVKMVLAQ